MASIIIMPKQGLLMEEGTITSWLVKEGETCTEGSPLFEMETDKLTITMDSTATGTLLKILHPEGDVVPITEPIAIVGEPGEDISALLGTSDAAEAAPETDEPIQPVAIEKQVGERVAATPRAKLRAEEKGIDIHAVAGTGPDGLITEQDIEQYLDSQPNITPLAANIAKSQGISLDGINGTGSNGKITAADLTPSKQANSVPAEIPAAVPEIRGTRKEKMSGMRKAICNNMLASKQANAQTSHRMVIDMSAVIDLRNQYKAMHIKVSYNDIIVRACAKALQDFPIVNASVDGNNILYHDYVHIGTAVSVSNGLIVPVIRDADIIGLRGIAAQSAELIDKARNGKLTDQEYHGGTFTVSSLGMFDLDDFVAIINPPESAILAVGKINKTPIVITDENGEDQIAIRPMCALTLSYDHRIIDGAEAAKFLQKIKEYLQNPILMI